MKSINIVRNGQVTNSAAFETQEELDAWYSYHVESFGEHEVQDTSLALEAEKQSREALAYLVQTDWYCARLIETGTEIPVDVRAARAEARTKI